MRKYSTLFFSLIIIPAVVFISCTNQNREIKTEEKQPEHEMTQKMKMEPDTRKSLHLNPMQKNHQLMNMRSHLKAVQKIITLLSSDKYEEASKVAHSQLGLTTKMKLMCSSFNDENFTTLGLEFHKSADTMGEVFKSRDKDKSLKALSNTIHYCVQCHSLYKQ